MTAPTHVTVSLLASILAAKSLGVSIVANEFLAIVLGSLAPDLDSPNSTITRPGTLLKRFIPRGIVHLLDDFFKGLSRTLNMALGHRGPLHWPIFGLLFIAVGYFNELTWLMWFGWAYIWHILADFCTVSGVPLWGPFDKRPVKWSPIRTGSVVEKLIFCALTAGLIYYGFPMLPEENQLWIKQFIHI